MRRLIEGARSNQDSNVSLFVEEQAFRRYGKYYDLLYRDKNYEAEADYVARTLHSSSSNIRTLLEFGSGTGRHGRNLARHGFHVFGIERSESMVAKARGTAIPAGNCPGEFSCEQGDIRTVELNRAYDAVISLFHVVSYQTTNQDLLMTFRNAVRHLSDGGIFLFDVWHGPAVLQERPSVRVKRMEDEHVRLTRIAEPELDTNAGVVTVNYTIFAEEKADQRVTSFAEIHRMRYLFPSEVEFLARQTGFRVEHSEEFLTGKPPSSATWGVVYLLRKCASEI